MFYSTPQDYARTKLAYPISWPLKSPADSDGFPCLYCFTNPARHLHTTNN